MWTEEPLTDGGPPTRLRYLVGSAIGRLRRGRVIEERVAANGAFSVVGVPAEPHRSGPSQEPMETARPDEGAPEDGPVAGDFAIEADSPEETAPTAQTTETPRVDEPSRHDPEARPDFLAVAQLCTELGRVDNIDEMQPILAEAVRILDAVGLIVWVWDAPASELRPALASGYSDKMLAQLPTVKRDADNPTAAAFRSQRTFEINGTGHTRGALVIPLLTPAGCAGVLALELRQGLEATTTFSRATATIFAALVAQLVGAPPAVMEQPEIVAAVRSG
jgi:hypothetical protein